MEELDESQLRFVRIAKAASNILDGDAIGALYDTDGPLIALCAAVVAGLVAQQMLDAKGQLCDQVAERLDWTAQQLFDGIRAKAVMRDAMEPIVSESRGGGDDESGL